MSNCNLSLTTLFKCYSGGGGGGGGGNGGKGEGGRGGGCAVVADGKW